MKDSIQSVRYIGTFPRHRADQWVMVGQDGGQSIPLENGTLFVFSDTLLAALSRQHPHAPVPRPFTDVTRGQGVFLANSAGVSAPAPITEAWANIRYFTGEGGFPREILQPIARERAQRIRFWPVHGALVNGKVLLYYLGIQTVDASTIWGFRTLGTGIATLDPATGVAERVWFGDEWRLWKSFGDDAHFGVQVLRQDGYLYVFGSVRFGIFCTARLARVRPDEATIPGAYEYLASSEPEWSGDPERACDLGLCGGDYSVSFNPHLGQYVMFYVDGIDRMLKVRTAGAPWGPYSEPEKITGVPAEPESELVYLGFEHPDFSQDGGRTMFISYCQPRFTSNSLLRLQLRGRG